MKENHFINFRPTSYYRWANKWSEANSMGPNRHFVRANRLSSIC